MLSSLRQIVANDHPTTKSSLVKLHLYFFIQTQLELDVRPQDDALVLLGSGRRDEKPAAFRASSQLAGRLEKHTFW